MKRSPRHSRTSANLSESVHRQLNMYALAASAAGVGALALVAPAEARIIYTPAHHVIGENQMYQLALNHRERDFFIYNKQCLGSQTDCGSSSGYAWLNIFQSSTGQGGWNQVVGYRTNGSLSWASALKRGTRISKQQVFVFGAIMVELFSRTTGPWNNVTNRYLGLKFKIDGKFHYGWARLNVEVARHPPRSLSLSPATLTKLSRTNRSLQARPRGEMRSIWMPLPQ
jgi:hypothetical protein